MQLRTGLLSVIAILVLTAKVNAAELLVLGVVQDAGYPQMNCYRPHCMPGWKEKNLRRPATALAVIDRLSKQKLVFEAPPHMPEIMYQLHQVAPDTEFSLDGIFLTHAHIGHYTGLMYFGREAAGSKNVPVYAMPKMATYLSTNGPWSQLVKLNNIKLMSLNNQESVRPIKSINVTPLQVPHRDEYSETVGYRIQGPSRSVLFIPDIDKWQKWKFSIVEQVKSVDYAFLDATFYSQAELPNRDISEIPHPLVTESMALFSKLTPEQKRKVIFIHLNHSNPLLDIDSDASKQVIAAGYRIAREGMKFQL